MGERPILFSAPMVRAILEGRKTVTRRVVRDAKPLAADVTDFGGWVANDAAVLEEGVRALRRPYGEPGDRLWVRETWGVLYESTARDDKEAIEDARRGMPWACITYPTRSLHTASPTRWRPSIHMPRWASRITLEVVDVRVERLNAIDEDDARREGFDANPYALADGTIDEAMSITARDNFAALWDSLNGDRAPWSSNPWVWRVEFRRLP